jgi:hypothetical protein
LPAAPAMTYPAMVDAVDDVCYRLRLPWDDAHRSAVAQLIEKHWVREMDGSVTVPVAVPPNVVLSWQPQGRG